MKPWVDRPFTIEEWTKDLPKAYARSMLNLRFRELAKKPDSLVPYYFNLIADTAPWLVGLLAVCALAAMQFIRR